MTKKQALEKKIREYRKILKDDEDWDWAYILRMLRYKLERTRKCIVKNGIIADAPKVASQIRAVEILLDRVDKNRYYDQISKDFRKKYGRLRMISGKARVDSRGVPVTFKFERETPGNSKQIHREHLRLWRKAELMQHSDLKKAFDLMLKDIWGWWD